MESLADRLGAAEPLVRVGVALAILLGGLTVSRFVRAVLRRPLTARRGPSFGRVMSRLVGMAVSVAALSIAVTVAFPSVKPVDLFAGLGIVSIAAGFAFQDILSNLLSGLLLLIRQPFRSGDEIKVNGAGGVVEGITIRETTLRTYDGQRLIIPNRDVYQSTIEVRTAFEARRTTVTVGVGYDDDLDEARRTAVETMRSTDGVMTEPPPQAQLVGFGGSSMDIELRFWTAPDQATVREVTDRVIAAVKAAYDSRGIDIPFPIRTLGVPGGLDVRVRRDGSGPSDGSGGRSDGAGADEPVRA